MIALIDGDVMLHIACKSAPEDTDRAVYLGECWRNLRSHLKSLLETLFTDEYLMGVGGSNNFRYNVYSAYKSHRQDKDATLKSEVFPALKAMTLSAGLAVPSDGRETDDLLRIWAEECRYFGKEYVICSIDKDLLCIPGMHFNLRKNVTSEVSELEAMRHYHEQLLKGDPTDAIPGVPGVGDKTAAKLLVGCSTEAEMQEVVISEYFKAYGPEGWSHALLLNGKLIHLQRHITDYFSFDEWPTALELL